MNVFKSFKYAVYIGSKILLPDKNKFKKID